MSKWFTSSEDSLHIGHIEEWRIFLVYKFALVERALDGTLHEKYLTLRAPWRFHVFNEKVTEKGLALEEELLELDVDLEFKKW